MAGLIPIATMFGLLVSYPHEPRLVMVVVVNDPKAGASGGGTVAAPIFAQVARHSLRVLGVSLREHCLSVV